MDDRIRRPAHIGRREFLAASGTALALGSLPARSHAQAKRSGEIAAGLSERMLTLDPANHYSISTTSVLRHVFDPLRRRHQRLEVRPCARRVVAPRQQHDLALHAPEGRHVPRRHAVQCGQRGVHLEARPRQHQAHQVVRLPGPRVRGEGRGLRRRRHLQAALRLSARAPHDARDAPAERGQERGGILPEARGHGALPLCELDPWRSDRAHGESELLEAWRAEGREADVSLHPGAVDPHRGAPSRRAPRDRPRDPGPRRDAQGQSRRQGPRRAGDRGPALASSSSRRSP